MVTDLSIAGRQIVQDHDVGWRQVGDQDAADIDREGLASHRPVKQPRRGRTGQALAECGCGCLPMALVDAGLAALAAPGTSREPRLPGRGTRLDDEGRPAGGEIDLTIEPGLTCDLDVRPALPGGVR